MYVALVGLALLIGAGLGWWIALSVTSRRTGAVAPPPVPREPDGLPALVLEALGEGVVVVDRADTVLLTNPAALSLGALTADRLGSDALRRLAREALDDAEVRLGTVELRRGYLGRETVTVGVAAVPIHPNGSDRPFAVALLLDDLTDAHRLENVRRDFVANISHELKTPVGALTLLAEAVQAAADDPEQVTHFAERMQREGQRLGKLIGELIALSRVQGAEARPGLDPILVEDIIDEAMDRTHLSATAVGITLMSTVEPGLLVTGSEEQLITAVENLIENAIAYSPDGTKVVLSGRWIPTPGDADNPRGWVEIAITDQGMGIAESDLDRIFERFYRVDPARSRATGGTGLGLSIVKHVVTNHGGTVTVWSSEGDGSTFTLRLPPVSADPPLADLATTSGRVGR